MGGGGVRLRGRLLLLLLLVEARQGEARLSMQCYKFKAPSQVDDEAWTELQNGHPCRVQSRADSAWYDGIYIDTLLTHIENRGTPRSYLGKGSSKS